MYNYQTPIQYVKGVGPVKAQEFKGMGIEMVGDLLEYQPLHYVYPGITPIKDLKEGYAIIRAKIISIDRVRSNVPIVEARLNDSTGACKARWWNQVFVIQHLHPGMTVTFWGKYKAGIMAQPKFSTLQCVPEDIVGGYYGIHDQTMKKTLKEVFKNCELPSMVEEVSRLEVFHNLHFPKSKDEHKEALKLLKEDELLLMQLAILKNRTIHKNKVRGKFNIAPPRIMCLRGYNQKVISYFPYKFTNEQQRVIDEICVDLNKRWGMNRLLHGDVGCGKTAIAFYAAMLTTLNNKRALILCPTTILAQQHYDTLKGMGWYKCSLYLQKGIIAPSCSNIIIGTHALLNNKKLLKSSSLVIIDEFQKFGVKQRAKIQQYNPHLLLMSATPIPRTLAMSVFGDLDVSTIKELPIERGTVITRWVVSN